jgi:hypothetical protein
MRDASLAVPVCVEVIVLTQPELTCWDPKDGELCLNRAKPEETLVEARSRSDVQIDGQIWV